MSIIETDQAHIIATVQRQRVQETMRPLRRRASTPNFEFHPIASFRINDQNLSIQVQKGVKTGIVLAASAHYGLGYHQMITHGKYGSEASDHVWSDD